MAQQQRRRQASPQGGGQRRSGRASIKSREEARIERLTWLAMAGVFILLSMFDPDNRLPDYVVAFVITGILLISAIYQFMQTAWRVSPFVWMIGAVLGAFAAFAVVSEYYGWIRVPIDLRLVSLAVVVTIILLGIITNEG
jgi:peptidoglycan/LPS O-acetylase OafA/YrhL